jgi:hypothetical protein
MTGAITVWPDRRPPWVIRRERREAERAAVRAIVAAFVAEVKARTRRPPTAAVFLATDHAPGLRAGGASPAPESPTT